MRTRVGRRSERGRPNSHFGCREHDDDDEYAVRRSLAHCRAPRRSLLCAALLWLPQNAAAQDRGSSIRSRCRRSPIPTIPRRPPRSCSAAGRRPATLAARTIGFYAKGCLAGGAALPINGPTWQVMRLSRNRNWGHPDLVRFLEKLSDKAPKAGWRGLLVGDMSQPRGGPMITGHASHQVGLDADIWLTPMPDRELTRAEREEMSATMVVAEDRKDVDPKVWTPAHVTSSRRRRRTRRSSASSSIRRSRRRCAARPAPTAPGSARCGRSGATTITSTSASAARPTARNASRSRRRRRTTAAARSWTTGSPMPSCIPSRRRRRRSPGPGFAWPICRTPAGACCWRRSPALDRGSLLAPARHKYLVIPDELLNLER